MRATSFVPPVGYLIPVAVSVIAGIALQGKDTPPVQANAVAVAAGNIQPQARLSLPKPSDPDRALTAFSDRPLLAKGRRPFSPGPPETDPIDAQVGQQPNLMEDAPEPPSVAMLGSLENGDGWQVLLHDATTGQQAWLRIGDTVIGWTIVAIQPQSASLQLLGAEITLHMFDKALP